MNEKEEGRKKECHPLPLERKEFTVHGCRTGAEVQGRRFTDEQ